MVTREVIKTPITEDYQAEKWGIPRIVLDAVQNHMPSDSGGNSVQVLYSFGNECLPREQALRLASSPMSVSAITFSDDGVGFDYRKLGLFLSHKPNEGGNGNGNGHANGPVGQFGEGMKLMTAACLRQGMSIRIRSRDWQATARMEEVPNLDGITAHQMVYDIETGLPPIRGSSTTIYRPTKDLVEYVNDLGRNCLFFRNGYRSLCSDGNGNHVVDEKGDIFVKGFFVTSEYAGRLLFSYDLNIDELPRDRDYVKEQALFRPIGEMLANTNDRNIVRKILKAAITKEPSQVQYADMDHVSTRWEGNSGYGRAPANPQLWAEVFRELFGDNAVLYTDEAKAKMARLAGHAVYHNNCHLASFLSHCGVKQDAEVVEHDPFLFSDFPGFVGGDLRVDETSATLSYRAGAWGARRMVLDALANHMPADSGGKTVLIKYRTCDPWQRLSNEWVDHKSFGHNQKIVEVAIEDDGRGYDYQNLLLFLSSKHGAEVGHFGEGMKLLSTAALRKDIKVKFCSRDWVAVPFAAKRLVDGKEVEVLCFRALGGVSPATGSRTVLANPDQEMIEILKHIDDLVLPMRGQDFRMVHTTPAGVGMFVESEGRTVKNGSVFSKGFFLTDAYSGRLLFSYDLRTDKESPNRDNVDFEELKGAVAELVSTCKDREAIARIIRAAEKEKGAQLLEFQNLPLSREVAELWKEAFYGIHGRNAVISTTPYSSVDAAHRGFKLVSLDENIAAMLANAGVATDSYMGTNSDEVPLESLTPQERKTLSDLSMVDLALNLPPFDRFKVCTRIWTNAGLELPAGGYWDGTHVWIRRSNLSHFATAARVYMHERGHKETGASDPEDGFRDFFEYLVSAFVGEELSRMTANPSYRCGIDQFRNFDFRQISQLQADALSLRSENARLQSENSACRAAMLELSQLRNEAPRLRSENASLSAANSGHEASMQEQDARIRQLEAELCQLQEDRSRGLDRGRGVSFGFAGMTVYVQPKPYVADWRCYGVTKDAILHKRWGLDRVLGYVLGRSNCFENKVDVFVSDGSFDPRTGVEVIKQLDEGKKVRFLRKIARQERLRKSTAASQALAKKQLVA